MKIAAWVTIGAYILAVVLMGVAISLGEFELGGFLKITILGTIALIWAIRKLLEIRRVEKEIKYNGRPKSITS